MNKVSIIVPVYKVEKYIEECVQSILAQTYSDMEVILVDDCSPDRSIELCEKLIADNPKTNISFKILKQPVNRGLSAARNLGLRNATGEYILFVDSDDFIAPNAIETLVNAILRFNADIVSADNYIFNNNTGEDLRSSENCRQQIACASTNNIISHGSISVTAWNKLIKKDFLISHNLFFENGLIYEDELWNSHIFSCNPKICIIPDKTYYYRIRENSILQSFTHKHFLSKLILLIKTLELIDYIKTDKSKRQIYKYLRRKIEGYRIGILMSAVRIDSSLQLFNLLYRYLKKNVNRSICFQSSVPLKTRIKAFDLIMPHGIDKTFCKKIINHTIKNWPYITGGQSINHVADNNLLLSVYEIITYQKQIKDKTMSSKFYRMLRYAKYSLLTAFTRFRVDSLGGGFWNYRADNQRIIMGGGRKRLVYDKYLKLHKAFIGIGATFASVPILPHGLNGIHISDRAIIGKDCIIYQQVTIGSNTIPGHPCYGSPTIGDNVLIGAGAKIIGKVRIGNNCRIGANCVVTKDIPENTTVVLDNVRTITHSSPLANQFIGINDPIAQHLLSDNSG